MKRRASGTASSPSRGLPAVPIHAVAAEVVEEVHNALPFRRFVGGRGQGRQAGDLRGREVAERNELRRAAIAHGDRAGLVQEQRIDVAGHFDRLAALGDDVRPQRPVHAGDADGRQQGADGRGDQADQQGDQRGHVGAQAFHRLPARNAVMYCSAFKAMRPERRGDDEEDQREGGQHQRQGDFVGRPLADGPFDQGDHAVEEGIAGMAVICTTMRSDKHAGAAGNAGAVAAGLADHRGRLAGDGRLVDRGHALDDFAVAGDHLAGDDLDPVAGCGGPSNRLFQIAAVRADAAGRGRVRRVFRSASAWALPRASAIAEAKLANSSVAPARSPAPRR